MNVFFEESGDFKSGVVLSQAGESFQVELASGKRSKIKQRDVLIQFEKPSPDELIKNAHAVAQELDLDFLWEVSGTEEFGFETLGADYFGHTPLPHEAAGLLIRLHGAPMYFYRKGRGRYKAAPEESLKAALAGLEKKRLQAEQIAAWASQLEQKNLPDAIRQNVRGLLFKPDKNSLEFKALDAACNALQTNPARLLLEVGALASARDYHMGKFLFEYFPKGTDFPEVKPPALTQSLPLVEVDAFSIDDATTTEIDDAFSMVELDDDTLRVGIHIAAPGLSIRPEDALDALARARMSTVYMPGDKITMLPDALVEAYTLGEGQARPALSLYFTVRREDWSITTHETRIERITVKSNLRHNDLDEQVTEEALAQGTLECPHQREIALLWQWVQVLEKTRMEKRAAFGLRPEQGNRVDFNFYVEDEVVRIVQRKRGAPLDKIVAELMILANSTWGKMLDEHGIPGIYRAQGGGSGTSWSARMAVRMVTRAAPHQGLGVDQYAWSTSPLRRYTDLVNQWQIMACVEHGVTAPLAAPFKFKDANLFSIVGAFEAAYAAYADFQSGMERYWCLRWLTQESAHIVEAMVLKDEVLRLVDIPLVIRLPGMAQAARGARVKLEIIRWDELDLNVEARMLEVLTPVTEALPEPEEEESEAEQTAQADSQASVQAS